MSTYDFAVVGGGIVGLATGMALGQRFPGTRVLVLEKESAWAHHQTGHNSGVIHSGIYYRPGSLKAHLAAQGNQAMVEFCTTHGIEHDVCGKVIVATTPEELPLLKRLYQRGLANGIPVVEIGPGELKEIEPHARGLAALRVPTTGIVSYTKVANAFARVIEKQGGDLRLGVRVVTIAEHRQGVAVESVRESFQARFLVNCAGLHSDRLAKRGGVAVGGRIVPFRGEYYELRPDRRYLVKHLIYPVPHPRFPFLGVHFTRMIDGGVHAGPNAVLSLKREGYRKSDFSLRDTYDVISYPAFWRFLGRNLAEASKEVVRSVSKAAFVRSLQKLLPDIRADDLLPAQAGVRAQALMEDGTLMDDFLIVPGRKSLHVCNAPSPAATASIPIGRAIAERVPSVA